MKRIKIQPRNDYKQIIEDDGFHYNSDYWLENAYYKFNSKEINIIEVASNQCYNMFVSAVQHVIDNNLWCKLNIPTFIVPKIIESWNNDNLSLYGRFDFAFINGMPKLLEFNADTPTSLFEAAIVQWNWKESVFHTSDQFNSIHESLVESFKYIGETYDIDHIDFTCILDNLEDSITTSYILSTASEAGLNTSLFDISQVAIDNDKLFYHDHKHLDVLFKLYPYEWMFNEEFGKTLSTSKTTFIEPLWKAIMSNKYMLVILAELYPDSPYILKASEQPLSSGNYCKKPIYSREGSNVSLVKNGNVIEETDGEYGEEGFIYQELVEIESQDGKYPVIGSWIIGGVACGMGIRETSGRITDNMANFVPHIF